jgi:hypothetical protein
MSQITGCAKPPHPPGSHLLTCGHVVTYGDGLCRPGLCLRPNFPDGTSADPFRSVDDWCGICEDLLYSSRLLNEIQQVNTLVDNYNAILHDPDNMNDDHDNPHSEFLLDGVERRRTRVLTHLKEEALDCLDDAAFAEFGRLGLQEYERYLFYYLESQRLDSEHTMIIKLANNLWPGMRGGHPTEFAQELVAEYLCSKKFEEAEMDILEQFNRLDRLFGDSSVDNRLEIRECFMSLEQTRHTFLSDLRITESLLEIMKDPKAVHLVHPMQKVSTSAHSLLAARMLDRLDQRAATLLKRMRAYEKRFSGPNDPPELLPIPRVAPNAPWKYDYWEDTIRLMRIQQAFNELGNMVDRLNES